MIALVLILLISPININPFPIVIILLPQSLDLLINFLKLLFLNDLKLSLEALDALRRDHTDAIQLLQHHLQIILNRQTLIQIKIADFILWIHNIDAILDLDF